MISISMTLIRSCAVCTPKKIVAQLFEGVGNIAQNVRITVHLDVDIVNLSCILSKVDQVDLHSLIYIEKALTELCCNQNIVAVCIVKNRQATIRVGNSYWGYFKQKQVQVLDFCHHISDKASIQLESTQYVYVARGLSGL